MGAISLNADLALAESEGKATIISAPKVIASNGETATISRGTTFYLPAAENVEAKEVNADLSLTVTPTVSFNDYVSMEISVTDESADGLTKSGKDITTKLMVKSGETIVIGGIYTEDTRKNDSGIPWLRNVPVVGWLFNAETNTESKTELLIFITPRVLPPPMSKTL
jgi:type IV pilus assembly protein PilQ